MRKLVIFGAGAFADLAHYYFSHDSDYAVVAFTVDAAYLSESSFKGLPLVPFEDVQRHFPPGDHDLFVAVGIRKVIGAGALILRSTRDDEVYRGQASTPSRVPSNRLWTF